jgi:Flp pilus assembly protein TadG
MQELAAQITLRTVSVQIAGDSLPRCRIAPRKSSSAGQAVLEFAIVLPILVMILTSTFELGRALRMYLSLSRLAYEGARYASAQPGLEKGCYGPFNTAPQPAKQKWVREVIDKLIVKHVAGQAPYVLETALSCDENGDFVDDNKVRVVISSQYEPMFVLFPMVPIRVMAIGAYLYPSTS